MQVRLIGIGCKADRQLTIEALEALKKAELIVGAKRMLEALPEKNKAEKKASYLPAEILQILQESEAEKACVLYSGDSGFYSGARSLLPLLEKNGIEAEVLPGISSLQTLAAKTGKDWQEWKLCSAHGVECDVLSSIMGGKPCLFLTGGTSSPQSICRELTEAGLGELSVIVGEKLSYPEERILKGKAKDIAEMEFDTLSLLLTEAAPVYPKTVPGIPDEAFIRDKVPMTKREVRAAILASLAIGSKDICWDIGAGTGSVSIEMALHSSRTYAIEQKEEALALIHKNREKFCAWNLKVLQAKAPEGLAELPKPDAVFVGGSGGNMAEIIGFVHERNPQARICISAIALESLQAAMKALDKYDYEIEISQISVSRSKAVAGLHMLMAQNPIFLIKGEKK